VIPGNRHPPFAFLFQQLVDRDFLGPELVAAVNDGDMSGDVGEYSASSTAVLPPPITATRLLR
jgi:hypothetical protein